MSRIYTVPPDELIEAMADYLFNKYPEIEDGSILAINVNTKTKELTCKVDPPETPDAK